VGNQKQEKSFHHHHDRDQIQQLLRPKHKLQTLQLRQESRKNDSQTQHVATSTVYVRLHCGILRPITLLLYSSPSVQISSHEDREGQTQALRTLPDSWTNGEARCTQTASKQADHNKSTSAFISFIVGRCDSPSILTRFHDSLAHSQRPTVNGTLPSARPDARMFRERCVRHGTRMKPFQKMHSKEHG
jgi:hypothetical protein